MHTSIVNQTKTLAIVSIQSALVLYSRGNGHCQILNKSGLNEILRGNLLILILLLTCRIVA